MPTINKILRKPDTGILLIYSTPKAGEDLVLKFDAPKIVSPSVELSLDTDEDVATFQILQRRPDLEMGAPTQPTRTAFRSGTRILIEPGVEIPQGWTDIGRRGNLIILRRD